MNTAIYARKSTDQNLPDFGGAAGRGIAGRRRSDDSRVEGAEGRGYAGGRRGGPRVADQWRDKGCDRGRTRVHRVPKKMATSTPPPTRMVATSNHTPLIPRKQDKHFGKRPGTQKHFGKRSGMNGWCVIVCRRLTSMSKRRASAKWA